MEILWWNYVDVFLWCGVGARNAFDVEIEHLNTIQRKMLRSLVRSARLQNGEPWRGTHTLVAHTSWSAETTKIVHELKRQLFSRANLMKNDGKPLHSQMYGCVLYHSNHPGRDGSTFPCHLGRAIALAKQHPCVPSFQCKAPMTRNPQTLSETIFHRGYIVTQKGTIETVCVSSARSNFVPPSNPVQKMQPSLCVPRYPFWFVFYMAVCSPEMMMAELPSTRSRSRLMCGPFRAQANKKSYKTII